MRTSFWNKRFPTIIGLLLITITIGALTFATRSQQIFHLGARSSVSISDIRVSNQTDTSLSISFTTNEGVSAQLRFGPSLDNAAVVFDDRDTLDKETGKYQVHHFTLSKLKPSQQYLFLILVDRSAVDNNGQGFIAKTAAALPDAQLRAEVMPVGGSVLTAQGQGAKDALVFVKLDGATLLSTVVKPNGQFLIPLTKWYALDLASLYSLNGSEVLTIEVVGPDGGSLVTVPFGKHGNLAPITLGITVSKEAIQPAVQPESSGFQTVPQDSDTETTEEKLLKPDAGEFLLDQKPLFQGKSKPSQTIEITIESEPQTVTLKADKNGSWSYQPDTPLPAGTHSVSVRFFDGNTVTKVVSRQFAVFAVGTQVSESATPSASPRPSPTTAVLPSPTKTAVPTTTKTPVVTASPRPSPTPTKIPNPTIPTRTPTPIQALAPSGTTMPTVFLLSVGTSTILIGLLILGSYAHGTSRLKRWLRKLFPIKRGMRG